MKVTPQLIEAIREYMERTRSTQKDVAERVPCSPAAISRILAGERKHVSDRVGAGLIRVVKMDTPTHAVVLLPATVMQVARAEYIGKISEITPDGHKIVLPDFAAEPGAQVLARTPDGEHVEGRLWHAAIVTVDDGAPAGERFARLIREYLTGRRA